MVPGLTSRSGSFRPVLWFLLFHWFYAILEEALYLNYNYCDDVVIKSFSSSELLFSSINFLPIEVSK